MNLNKGCTIKETVSPEKMLRFVSEGILVERGIPLDADCRITATFQFNGAKTIFECCRVEIEVL